MGSPGCNIRHISKAHVFAHQAVQPFLFGSSSIYFIQIMPRPNNTPSRQRILCTISDSDDHDGDDCHDSDDRDGGECHDSYDHDGGDCHYSDDHDGDDCHDSDDRP